MITLRNVILLLGAISVVGSFQFNLKKCLKRQGFFPKPGSMCKAYYRCSNWIPVEELCPEDELFNPIAGICDWRDTFPCLDKPKRKECPRNDGRFLKPGTMCKVYYDCCNGEPTEKTCPPDQLFDPDRERCEWSELYTCAEQPKRKECLKENGRFLKPGTNCKRYYDCHYGEPTEKVCPPDELFDPSTGNCEWSELYTCVESIPTGIPTINTISTMFKISTSDDDQNYKTSELPWKASTTPFDPNIQSSAGVTGSTGAYISTSASSYDELTSENHLSSSTHTGSDPNVRSSPGITGSTIAYTRTSSSSYDDLTRENHLSSSPHTGSDPNVRSSPGITGSTSAFASTSGSSYDELTSKNHLSSSPYTGSDPNVRSSTGITGSTGTYTRTSGFSYDELSSENHLSSSPSDPNVRSSTTGMGSSFGDMTSTTAEISSVWDVKSSTIVDIWCPEPVGYFPHPTDKHKFVGCVDSVPSVLTCPSNLVYKHKLRRCDYE